MRARGLLRLVGGCHVSLVVSLIVWLGLSLAACTAGESAGQEVRSPAVAGQFYPEDPAELKTAVEKYLRDAMPAPAERPLALVSPHAGYVFSGQIQADAFRRAQGHDYNLVVLLGTNHTSASLRGVAVYKGKAFKTPLGNVEIDAEATSALLAASKECRADSGPHAREHSIEVQVPFVQCLFPRAKIVAAVVGHPDAKVCTNFGGALAKVLQGRKALIVASSDLSHYPDYEGAGRSDRAVLEAIARLDPEGVHAATEAQMKLSLRGLSTCACGEAPILAAVAAAKALGAARGAVVSYANSGDTLFGEKDRVVGYGAVAFYAGAGEADVKALEVKTPAPEGQDLLPEDKKALLALARDTIDRYLSTKTVPLPRNLGPRAERNRGAFVTLKNKGQLRGCIGHMAEDAPLPWVVGAMALQAALNDRRFSPLGAKELPDVEIEISMLTPAKPVSSTAEVVVGRDGVILKKGGRSAVYLPQVATEQGWGLEEMLDNLSRKAGLPAGSWREGAQLSTFQAVVFHESEFKAAK